jgi:hypothetical protein
VRSATEKLWVGIGFGGASIDSDDMDVDQQSGGAGVFRLGYGFTRLFSLYLEGAAASIEDAGETFTLSHGDLGVRFHFGGPQRAFIPFLDLGLSARALSVDDFDFVDDQGDPVTGDLEISGGGLSFGGGFLYFFNPNWALDLGLKFTTGEFTTVKVDNVSFSGFEVDANSSRLMLGVTWFPMSGR